MAAEGRIKVARPIVELDGDEMTRGEGRTIRFPGRLQLGCPASAPLVSRSLSEIDMAVGLPSLRLSAVIWSDIKSKFIAPYLDLPIVYFDLGERCP